MVIALAGCRTAPDPDSPAGLRAMVEDFRSQSAEEQLALIASTSSEAERELWVLSGLEEELGGADAADEILAVRAGPARSLSLSKGRWSSSERGTSPRIETKEPRCQSRPPQ